MPWPIRSAPSNSIAARISDGLRPSPACTVHPKPSGLDYEIAGLLAKKLGVALRVYWAYSQHDSYPSKLATKKFCDVMLGVMPDDRFGRRVIYSKPYYYASYQFVAQADSDSPLEASPLAVERGIAVRGIRQRELHEYANLEAILDAIVSGKERVGYVISTRSHWLAEQRWQGKLKFVDGASKDRFPICAAVRKNDVDLKAAIDQALAELAESGELAKVFARWHIPYTRPQGEANE